MTEAPGNLRAWGTVVLCAVAYLVLGAIPAPGIDHEVLEQLSQSGGMLGLFNVSAALPMVSLLGSGLGGLVLVRGALAVLPRPSRLWSVLGFVAYEVIAMIAGLTTAIWLESTDSMSPFGTVVMSPGWGFRLLLALTYAAGAAVVWALALAITRTHRAHGTLLLSGISLLLYGVTRLASIGPMVQVGSLSPAAVIGPALFGTLPLVVTLIALWRFSPKAWPVPFVRQAALLSPLDVMVLPYVAGGLATSPALLVTTFLPANELTLALSENAMLIEPFFSLAAAVGLAVWMARCPAETRRTGSVLFAIAGPVVLGSAAIVVVLSLVASGWLERAVDPGPFAGDRNVDVVLVSEDPGASGPSDARALVERLEGLGVDTELISADTGTIRLSLNGVSDEQAALAAVTPRRLLQFRLVAEDQGGLDPSRASGPPPPGLEAGRDYDGDPMWIASSAEALAPVLAALDPAERERTAIECRTENDLDGNEPALQCSPFLLDEVILDGTHVADAQVQMNEYDNRPQVALEFDAVGAQRFGDVTAANIQRKLAIVLDGRIQSAPVIQTAIRGGRAQITLGSAMGYQELIQEANELVVALRSGALSATWRVGDVTSR